MIGLDQAREQMRACFLVGEDALQRGESILELQHAALAAVPPARLPEAATIAALSRLRSGEVVIPRERWPIETLRVARLLRALAATLAPGPIEDLAPELVEAALLPALADDGGGVMRVAERLELPPEVATALLREALKPEMLRLSLPFGPLVGDAPRGAACPLCHGVPCALTSERHACCRWCGTIWRWSAATCPSCQQDAMKERALTRVVRGSVLSCASCGDGRLVFPVAADPLLLSLLAVFASPLDLALRVGANATPFAGFQVF